MDYAHSDASLFASNLLHELETLLEVRDVRQFGRSEAGLVSALSLPGVLFAESPGPPSFVPQSSSASAQDRTFLRRAISTDHLAIDEANIVLGKTDNQHLKELAQTAVQTHTKMLEQLEEQGRSTGVSLPDDAGPAGKRACDELSSVRSSRLGEAFISNMVKLHSGEVQMFRTEAEGGQASDLKTLSQEQLPLLQQHLDDLKGIEKSGL